MSMFTGFSDEDLKRIKCNETGPIANNTKMLKKGNLAVKKPVSQQYKTLTLQKQPSDNYIDDVYFEKCKLSIKSNESSDNETNTSPVKDESENTLERKEEESFKNVEIKEENGKECDTKPDIVRGVDLTEDELASHRAKLEELQLKQKLMEEQNKKRKEMLAKALADRTRQTEEEVQKLEKIKKELQILDGQFSQDVAVLRKKIDQACLSYSDAEKNYLKVEKEFLQAKILLQKEKEKKELLTEHLCALITHNETRKAQKLETLMLELATNKTIDDVKTIEDAKTSEDSINVKVTAESVNNDSDAEPVIIDGVDQASGKIVEFKT